MNADLLVTIAPMAPAHVEGFRRAVDVVARERKYLTFLEAPPLEESREFVLEFIARGDPQFVASTERKSSGGAISCAIATRFICIAERWEWAYYPATGAKASGCVSFKRPWRRQTVPDL